MLCMSRQTTNGMPIRHATKVVTSAKLRWAENTEEQKALTNTPIFGLQGPCESTLVIRSLHKLFLPFAHFIRAFYSRRR